MKLGAWFGCLFALFMQGKETPKLSDFLQLPIVRQETDYSCGPATLLSVLRYWGVYDGNESGLYEIPKVSPQSGVDSRYFPDAARFFGLRATMKEHTTLDELQEALSKGVTVVVDYQAWADPMPSDWGNHWESGHYSAVVGMDDKYIYLMDPALGKGYGFIPRDEFIRRWHDVEHSEGVEWKNHRLAVFIEGERKSKHPEQLHRVR